jgi:hypothetical protein
MTSTKKPNVDLNQKVKSLEAKLRMNSFILSFLTRFIEKKEKIKISDLLSQEDNVIDIYPLANIDIRVHNEPKIKKKGKSPNTFKSVPHVPFLLSKEDKKLREKSEDAHESPPLNIDNKIKNIKKSITTFFENVKSAKDASKLEDVKKYRSKLFPLLELADYTKIITDHFEKTKTIISQKKLKVNIHTLFTPLEHRFGFLEEYSKINLDSEEVTIFLKSLQSPKLEDLLPFSRENLYHKLANYAVALVPIEEIVSKNIFNMENNKSNYNIIYIPLNEMKEAKENKGNKKDKKETKKDKKEEIKGEEKNDPYSFYYLSKMGNKEEKYWKIDPRLEEISRELSESLINYCIDLFRKIYLEIFGDHTFRSDFNTFSDISTECYQIFLNIITLSNKIKFCKLLQSATIKFSTHEQIKGVDKLDLTSDDKHQKKRFNSYGNDKINTDILENLCRLFDDPDRDRINRMIKNIKVF